MPLSRGQVVKIVREYHKALKSIFGSQMEQVILYGSFARDEARMDSDVDVLVVLRAPFNYAEAIRQTSELTARISLNHDVVISRVFASADEVRNGNLPFFINIRREGVAA